MPARASSQRVNNGIWLEWHSVPPTQFVTPHTPHNTTVAVNAAAALRLLQDVMIGNIVPGAAVSRAPLPIADLPNGFTISTGLRPDQLIRKWYCPLGRLPAWRYVVPTQLPRPLAPKTSKVQQDLLRKYTKVMRCLIGQTSETLIAANIEFATVVLWENLARLGGFPASARWSCTYLYDKLTPDICARALSCVISGADFLRTTPVALAAIREVDTNVKGMYAVCCHNLMQRIAEKGLGGMDACLSGNVVSVYGKLMSLKSDV